MDAEGAQRSGGSLVEDSGHPQSRGFLRRATIAQSLGTGLSLAAVSAAAVAIALALGGSIPMGVIADEEQREVLRVSAGSVAWSHGVREGQDILTLRAPDDGDGWLIETRSDGVVRRSEESGVAAQLRVLAIANIAALALGLGALLRAHRRAQVAAAVACVALALASLTASTVGIGAGAGTVLVTAMLAPALWIVTWGRWAAWARASLVAVAVAGTLAWVAARSAAHPIFDAVEALRLVLTYGILVVPLVGFIRTTPVRIRDAFDDDRAWIVDVGAVVALGSLLVAALTLANLPPYPLVIAAVGVALVYPRLRAWLVALSDRVLFSDLRQRLRSEAVEDERARLARELHDAPLQELAGVIRRLELNQGATLETDALRLVADELRSISTQLHPPVLEDYGLGPALEFLFDHARMDGVPGSDISLEIHNLAGMERAARPPQEVETAIFRIAQEALNNALQHSGAGRIVLLGHITATAVDLQLEDDGRGLTDGRVEAAGHAGRLGIASMRQRADIIGARLELRGSAVGTTVRITWSQ